MWNVRNSTILILFFVCFLPLASAGEGTSAEEYFLQGQKLVEDNAGSNMGATKEGMEAGIDALRKALEADYPNIKAIYKLLGNAYLEMTDYDKSYRQKRQDLYEILLKIAPDDPDVMDEYASSYLEDDKARQIEFYRRIIKLDPKRAEARYVLGKILIDTGSVDEGVKSVVEAINMESRFRTAGNYVIDLTDTLRYEMGCPLSEDDAIRKKVHSMRQAFNSDRKEMSEQAIVDMANFKKEVVKKFANHKCPAKKK
jgi:tetratricopeptide (TPR) repeat protein